MFLPKSIIIFVQTALLLFLILVSTFAYFDLRYDIGPDFLVKHFIFNLASVVGVGVSVPPNPFNTLAEELQKKEKELEQREAALAARQNSSGQDLSGFTSRTGGEEMKLILYITIIGITLLLLILINFYFDLRREEKYHIRT
jgi:hypothetical protein